MCFQHQTKTFYIKKTRYIIIILCFLKIERFTKMLNFEHQQNTIDQTFLNCDVRLFKNQ